MAADAGNEADAAGGGAADGSLPGGEDGGAAAREGQKLVRRAADRLHDQHQRPHHRGEDLHAEAEPPPAGQRLPSCARAAVRGADAGAGVGEESSRDEERRAQRAAGRHPAGARGHGRRADQEGASGGSLSWGRARVRCQRQRRGSVLGAQRREAERGASWEVRAGNGRRPLLLRPLPLQPPPCLLGKQLFPARLSPSLPRRPPDQRRGSARLLAAQQQEHCMLRRQPRGTAPQPSLLQLRHDQLRLHALLRA
mmetsp:Transcript_18597/g.61083  ORF Transcript_18597/g.61083 Transcript_18597/m.61083 type:complete len:253 (-) Transcript_18597:2432-3190(-)